MNNNKNIKPFYIYTDKNSLYIKNINEYTEKLSNNIYTYSANIDRENNIHICCLDTFGKLVHIYNNNGLWKKKSMSKCFNTLKNIKDLRLYVIDNLINLFVVEKSPISENSYKISHFYFEQNNYKLSRYNINGVVKDKESIYKLNIDEFSNIIFEYKHKSNIGRSIDDNTIIFNTTNKNWIHSNHFIRSNTDTTDSKQNKSNIKDDIFDFCCSIKYKL